jgi:hypothetical protein
MIMTMFKVNFEFICKSHECLSHDFGNHVLKSIGNLKLLTVLGKSLSNVLNTIKQEFGAFVFILEETEDFIY